MDPVSQAAVGAAAAMTRSQREQLAKAALFGALAGMAPDLDVLIQSDVDPLLGLQYHRHFTHSLVFIPFGAALCAAVFHALWGRRWQLPFSTTYLWCALGMATHGLLDGCTTYGTHLLWPFTNDRVAWNIISVVDAAFTLPLLVMIVMAMRRQSRRWLAAGIAWALCYLGLGLLQHERALDIGRQVAAERGHTPVSIEAKPSFLNIAVWKIVYETEHDFYVDAVKVGIGNTHIWEGDSIEKFSAEQHFPWLDPDSQQAYDLERFRVFSSDYLGIDKHDPNSVVDIRYSMLPHEIDGMWGLTLRPAAHREDHALYFTRRDARGDAAQTLLDMIWYRDNRTGPSEKP